ncbi:hypothetical protein R83H12_02308 [Fibrobacteria bacterium R8-3-H12]
MGCVEIILYIYSGDIMNTLTQAYRTTRVPRGDETQFDELEYNEETLAAMQEVRDIRAGKIKTKSYATVAEMNADLDAEEDD